MRPIVTMIAILSFQAAAMMEKTVFLLCILVGSVSCKIPVDCQPDFEGYEFRCSSKKSCREVPVKRIDCGPPKICLMPPASHESLSSGCRQDLDPPSLLMTIKEQNYSTGENLTSKKINYFTSIEEPTIGYILNNSRPQGVHKIIPTTVLRL